MVVHWPWTLVAKAYVSVWSVWVEASEVVGEFHLTETQVQAASALMAVPVGSSGASWAVGTGDAAGVVSTETRSSSVIRPLIKSNEREVEVSPHVGSVPNRAEYGAQFIPEW